MAATCATQALATQWFQHALNDADSALALKDEMYSSGL